MAWVTWRQHRLQLYVMGALVGLLGLSALLSSIPIRNAYNRQAVESCLPPTARSGCELIVSHFNTTFAAPDAIARYLIVLPALAGLFVGAPLLAREFEQGTYRLAWTQSMTRRRWLLSKTLVLCIATAVAGGALAAIAMWWRQPFDSLEGRISPAAFDIEGLVVPAYAVFALAVGILAGLLLRRTIPAMSLAFGVFVALRLGVEKLVRPQYMEPLQRTAAGVRSETYAKDWVLQNTLVNSQGRPISTSIEDSAILHAQAAKLDPQEYLYSLGWRRVVEYQPDSRFWSFQLIEAGIFFALALVVLALAIWLVRRTPA
jgi:hypothetical protein